MRVVIMLSSVAMGGAERNVVSVLPYIRDLGVDVRLLTLNTRRDSPLLDDFLRSGIQRHDVAARRMIDPAAWSRFIKVLRDEKIDLVHAQDQDTIIYAGLAHLRYRYPTVMTRHVMVEPTDTWKEAVRARLLLLVAHYGYDRVVAASNAVRYNFARQARIPLDRIQTIYYGSMVDVFDTRDRRAETRARLGWDESTPVVLMVAVLRRGKGHEVLFKAIPALKSAVPGVKIMLVGDGELADSLREQAAPFGDTVEFMGQRTDVPDLLGASDALVLPSWAEALPNVLIEAGAAGIPAVTTDVGGAKEIVVDGETGYVVPPGDAEQLADRLIAVLTDKTEARRLGDAGYKRVRAIFSLETQAQQTVELYQRILSSKPARHD